MATKEWKNLSRKEKAIGITTLLLIVIIVIAGISAVAGGGDTRETTSQQVVDQSLSEPEQIKQIVNKVLSGKVNDKEYVRKIDIVDQPGGSYGCSLSIMQKISTRR